MTWRHLRWTLPIIAVAVEAAAFAAWRLWLRRKREVDGGEAAWAAVHDAVAAIPGWAVGPCEHHGEEASWQVAEVDLRPRDQAGEVRGDRGRPARPRSPPSTPWRHSWPLA